jgi:hypothetical protein
VQLLPARCHVARAQVTPVVAPPAPDPDYLRWPEILHEYTVSLIVAVDFTGSNGLPSDKASLHYIGDKAAPSPYERAIRAVGEVLLGARAP